MKLDILTNKWIDIVFEQRNREYGAYEFRRDNSKNNFKAFVIGTLLFAFTIGAPLIISLIPKAETSTEEGMDVKMTTVKLTPKEEQQKKEEEKPKENTPPPPPPAPPVDVVKFVAPVVAPTNQVTEDIAKVDDTKDKLIGDQNIKGNKDAQLVIPITAVGTGDGPQVVEAPVEDNAVYGINDISEQPMFPGGMDKFLKYIANNFNVPETDEGINGKINVSFVVEKNGDLSNIRATKNLGPEVEKEAIRVLNKCANWKPGINSTGQPVRVSYTLPISIVGE